MIGIGKIPISIVWKCQNYEFQCLEKPKFTIPMFEKPKIKAFQCL